jgi:hypothetical protein
VQGYPKTCNTRFSFDSSDDIIGKSDTFKGFSKNKLPGIEDKGVSVDFADKGRDTLRIVGVDYLIAGFIPDKMITETYIDGVGLDEFRIVGIYMDKAPGNAVPELPVYKDH